MFQGAAQFNLDGKGRLTIPTRYRDMLLEQCAGQLVLTADADGCLLLYTQPEWQPLSEKVMKLSDSNPKSRALKRFLVGLAEDVVMDSAGRVLISANLREFAKLDKRVMLVGQGNKFELWDEERWQTQIGKMESFSADNLPAELEGFTL